MHIIINIILLVFFVSVAFSQSDTLHIKHPKHYFNTIILWDYYQKPEVILEPVDYVHQKLKSYQIKQNTIALNIPFYTKDFVRKDSSVSNISWLFTGYFLSYNPSFSGLNSKHILMKNGIGVRFVYNDGKKSIFFADVSPFSTIDRNYEETRVVRIASLLLWNYTVSSKFSFRLGLTKSFMWGNRYYLPYISFRVGSLDKVNFSFQFPRIISLNIPINNVFQVSIFTKPQGGLFSISNKDTIYAAFLNENKVVYLGRYEFLGGIRVDAKVFKWLAFYIAVGKSVNNFLAMYSLHYNKNNQFIYRPFFSDEQGKTPFINFGITGYLGKTKSYYQRKNIDEMIYMNNEMGVGDNNLQTFQPGDNVKHNKKFRVSNNEVADLINSFDY